MKHTENLTAFSCYSKKWYLLRADPVATNLPMLINGQELDFEPIREHEPQLWGANRSDIKKEKNRTFSTYTHRLASHTSYAM